MAKVNTYFGLASGPTYSNSYEFRIAGSQITGSLASPGAKTITIQNVPPGLNGSNTGHYIRISGGTGTAEVVLITGGTASGGGASGTLQFTTVNAHSGAYRITSATSGIQEAIYANVSDCIVIPSGTHNLYQKITVPRRMTFLGEGRNATILTLTSTTQSVFVSDTYGFAVHNLAFYAPGVQTAGVCMALIGTTPLAGGQADLEATGCDFYAVYSGMVANWPGGFIRAYDNQFKGILNVGIHHLATSAGVVQLVGNYTDGRTAPSMFLLEGSLGGGVVNDNWMQACQVQIQVNYGGAGGSTGAVNELIIIGNLLDMDSPSTALVAIAGGGTAGSNCVKITGNYISGGNFGVITNGLVENISITDNHIKIFGSDAAIAIAGATGTAQNIDISANRFESLSGSPNYIVQLSNPDKSKIWVKDNVVVRDSGLISAFIGVTGANTFITVQGNSVYGCSNMIVEGGGGATGTSQFCVKNNTIPLAANNINEALTLALPLLDDDLVFAVTPTATTITQMSGLSCPVGCKKSFIPAGGAVSWATSIGATDKIGRSVTVAAGCCVTFTKYVDGMWYPNQ